MEFTFILKYLLPAGHIDVDAVMVAWEKKSAMCHCSKLDGQIAWSCPSSE